MKAIEVLGIGCPKCKKTEKLIRIELDNSGLVEGSDYTLTKITDPSEIASKGVLATPGVVLDGKVVSKGKVPSKGDIRTFLGL